MIGSARSAVVLQAMCIILMTFSTSRIQGQPAILTSVAGGWTRADSVAVYAGKELFVLIDGGADLFFEYGFVRALSTEYSRSPDAIATVELYEMESPAAAYGLYSSYTAGTGTIVPVGQIGMLGEGYCIFWKGSYVGMLTAAFADSASAEMLLQLVRALAAEIRQTGLMPDLCTLLRDGGMELRKMVFVRGKLARGNHLSQLWGDPFPTAEGVVGTSDGSQYLILEFADAGAADASLHTAEEGWKKMRLIVERDVKGRWETQQRDGGIAMIEREGRYVVAVAGGREESEALAARLRRMLEGKE